MSQGKRTPDSRISRVRGNSPSQKQQKVQMLKYLSEEKAITAQFLKTEIERLLRQRIKKEIKKEIFPVEKRKGNKRSLNRKGINV